MGSGLPAGSREEQHKYTVTVTRASDNRKYELDPQVIVDNGSWPGRSTPRIARLRRGGILTTFKDDDGSSGPLPMDDRARYEAFAGLATEQRNPRTLDLDTLEVAGILERISAEDHTVAEAVARELPHVARAVELVEESFRAGGRLIYVGAGTSGRLGVLDASGVSHLGGDPRPCGVIAVAAGRWWARWRAPIIAGGRQRAVDGQPIGRTTL